MVAVVGGGIGLRRTSRGGNFIPMSGFGPKRLCIVTLYFRGGVADDEEEDDEDEDEEG